MVIVLAPRHPNGPSPSPRAAVYGRPMTASVHDIAAALRQRLPGLPHANLPKLLYYCQGHHLAFFDKPLFDDPIVATDHGPAVAVIDTTPGTAQVLDNAALDVITHVVDRYGGLTTRDLQNLTRAETPWRNTGPNEHISHDLLREYFTGDGRPSWGNMRVSREAVARALADARHE